MTSLFSYLLTFFGIAFWAFRALVTLLYQLDREFFATPINVTFEIIVLFSTLRNAHSDCIMQKRM